MKSRPGQGLIVKAMKIRLKQNDHASSRTQRSPHTRREQHRPSPSPTLAASSTAQALSHTRREQHRRSPSPTLAATRTAQNPARRPGPPANALELSRLHPNRPVQTNHFAVQHRVVEYLLHQHGVLRRLAQPCRKTYRPASARSRHASQACQPASTRTVTPCRTSG